jgi:hypothetical protein
MRLPFSLLIASCRRSVVVLRLPRTGATDIGSVGRTGRLPQLAAIAVAVSGVSESEQRNHAWESLR